MMRRGRTALIAMMLAAFGLGACHSARAGEFQLGGRRPQDVFTNAKTAALAQAACAGATAKIDALVKAGANVNDRGKEGITPLIWAMTCHNDAGIEALLQYGANPNQAMNTGESPTWLAAGGSDPKLLPILLDHGGNPDYYCADCQGTSTLENAIDYQRTANMKLLVQRGADVNFIGAHSPGQCAVAQGRFDYVIFLLQHGYRHDLQGLANSILQEKDTFGQRYWKGNQLLINPHWRDDKKQMQRHTYFKQALQMLAAKGFKARTVPWTVAPPPPPLPAAASSREH